MLKQLLLIFSIVMLIGCAEAENSDPKPQNLVSEENSDTDNSASNSGPTDALDPLLDDYEKKLAHFEKSLGFR